MARYKTFGGVVVLNRFLKPCSFGCENFILYNSLKKLNFFMDIAEYKTFGGLVHRSPFLSTCIHL